MDKNKTTVEVTRNQNENNSSLLRRFSRRVYDTGAIFKMKGRRYHSRDKSDFQKKQDALRRLAKKKEYERLYKLGRTRRSRR